MKGYDVKSGAAREGYQSATRKRIANAARSGAKKPRNRCLRNHPFRPQAPVKYAQALHKKKTPNDNPLSAAVRDFSASKDKFRSIAKSWYTYGVRRRRCTVVNLARMKSKPLPTYPPTTLQ